jgi:hypothetical protein
MYERSLKEQYPDKTHLGYNVRQLHTWIDKHVCPQVDATFVCLSIF